MTVVKTLPSVIVGFVPPSIVECTESEMPLDDHTRWYLAIDERDILEGQSVQPPLTLKEIVAICKEARAERYAEKQALANNR